MTADKEVVICFVCKGIMRKAKKRLPVPKSPLGPELGSPFTHDVYVAYFVCPKCLSLRSRIEVEKGRGELVATIPKAKEKSFKIRLYNIHLFPTGWLSRYIIIELLLSQRASSEEERRIVYALSEHEDGLELDRLQQLTELPMETLTVALENLLYNKLVEWSSADF